MVGLPLDVLVGCSNHYIRSPTSMDNEFCEEGLEVPSGILTGISLGISTDTEKVRPYFS